MTEHRSGEETAFLGFGTAVPEHLIEPEAALEMLGRLWPRLRAGAATAELVTRHSVEPLDRVVQRRSVGEAMALYAQHAPRLARAAACRALEAARTSPAEIDLVVSVSCTGYLVPSLDVRLAAEIGLRPDVVRLPLTELGCSGGAAAVAAAHRHLRAYPEDHVLVVAVELASLSFHAADRSLDNLAASMVFGDGAAAAVMGGADNGGLRVLAAGSRLVPESEHVLGFDLRDTGFHVVLDRRLPQLIEARLGPVVADFRSRHGVGDPAFYAVHAGGPRIFDAVESALGLAPDRLAVSRTVFREVGNLSSASILFSLAALPPDQRGDGLAIAFGPGVSVELAHLHRGPREVR
jgi:alkylresorcinol/alkylpyrone synthase